MPFELGGELLSAVLGTLVGYGFKFGIDKANETLVKDRLIKRAWNFLQQGETHIVIPLLHPTDIGATGAYGDLLAMSDVVTLANTFFPSSSSLSVQPVRDNADLVLENNLVVIGGGKYNTVYRALVERLSVPLHSFDTTEDSYTDIRSEDQAIKFAPTYDENGVLTHDVGLLVRARNPHNPNRWVVMAAGSHTFGTAAAMQFLTNAENLQDLSKHLAENLEIVVRARIRNHSISLIERISNILTW